MLVVSTKVLLTDTPFTSLDNSLHQIWFVNCQQQIEQASDIRQSDVNTVGQQTLLATLHHHAEKGIYTPQSSKGGIKRRVACYGLKRLECYNIKTNMSPNLDIDMFPARN